MEYKLSRKNKAGKWWAYGWIGPNKWGKDQASFKLRDLEELIEIAKQEGKEWVNLSMFENDKNSKSESKPIEIPSDITDMDDEIPF
jgi:hypothetical protein